MSSSRWILIAAAAAIALSVDPATCRGAERAAAEYLSDTLADRIVSVIQGWGELGMNTAVKPLHKEPMKLRIKDKHYEHGLGHHANGEIAVELAGQFETFETDIGIQWQGGSNMASVIFQVFVDDKKVFDSGIVRELDPPRHVCVSVKGAEELRLVAGDAGDGITCDCADWADARLSRDPAAAGKPAATGVDIVPFGHVCTWDPRVMTGTKAGRVDEFPAEDLYPARDLLPSADGTYRVPDWKGTGSIGVRWDENRLLRQVVLEFADAAAVPPARSIQLQYWTGESAWQGSWQPVSGEPQRIDNSLVWSLGYQGLARGTQKVRWVLVPTQSVGTRIRAYTRSVWTTVDVRIESARPKVRQKTEIELYNGVLLSPPLSHLGKGEKVTGTFCRDGPSGASHKRCLSPFPGGEGSPNRFAWDGASPLVLKVRASTSKRYKADRTVLRFRLPEGEKVTGTFCPKGPSGASHKRCLSPFPASAVAIEDLLANDCVYVPHAGLFVTRLPAPVTLRQYLGKIPSRSTVLDQVRRKPDQDFARAMNVVHNPIQDLGPMMLSLACDNRKFVVHREGKIDFDEYNGPDDKPRDFPTEWHLVPKFGSGKNPKLTRDLDHEWLPIPEIRVTEGEVIYAQMTHVTPLNDLSRQWPRPAPIKNTASRDPHWLCNRAFGVIQYIIDNEAKKAADVSLALNFVAAKKQPFELREFKYGFIAASGDRLLAIITTDNASPLIAKRHATGVVVSGRLPGVPPMFVLVPGPPIIEVHIPLWKVSANAADDILRTPHTDGLTRQYWSNILWGAMQVELPDPLLTNVIRASQVHCMLAARSEDHGKFVSPWISSDRYGPLESEANSIIRGMSMMGHEEFARRSLEFFIKRYNKAGFLTTGYTIVGTGEHLWTLAEHYERTRDRAWMQRIAPEVARVCQWVMRQRAKTKRLDAHGQKVPEYGLMPPGVTADWNRYAYRFFNEAQYCAGLAGAARALADVGHPAAAAIAEDAKQYREDLVQAYRWTQARMPVVRLESGVWVPDGPAMLDCFGRTEDFLPGEDWNRSWCYCVEIGAHHQAANRILDPASEEVGWIMDYLEDVQFLRSGMGDYPEEKNRKDVLCFGGFPKVQPYYGRIAEVYALRDEVKPFVRSYFNTIPTLLSRENLSFWEHFHNTGGWNKTHETGWFLCQSRIMLVMERGDELWLAPMVTNQWLKDGMKISVRNAPTRFGKVGYEIRSSAAKGAIEAKIEAPKTTARRIVIRLRHPDGKPMRAVTVQGQPHKDFDPAKETVTLAPSSESITVRAEY